MKKSVIAILILLLTCPFEVCAAGNAIFTRDISVKNERLFEVEVASGGEDVLTAGTFTLEYDAEDIAYRDVSTEIDGAYARAENTDGKTVVIFLCSRGVKLGKSAVLFKVKYKLVGNRDTSVKLSASDCTGADAQSIKPPKSALCGIYCIEGESKTSSRANLRRSVKSSSGSPKVGTSSGGSRSSNLSQDTVSRITEVSSDKRSVFDGRINFVLLLFATAAAVVIVLVSMRSNRKRDEKNK